MIRFPRLVKGLAVIPLFFLVLGCGGGGEEKRTVNDLSHADKPSQRESIRLKQYMVQGRKLYSQHCANCHNQEGKGLGRLIPPLAEADYLKDNLSASICLVKYGIEGSMLVNGVEYNQAMPANEKLTDLQIAEILTYVGNSWGNTMGLIDVQQVRKTLESCRKNKE